MKYFLIICDLINEYDKFFVRKEDYMIDQSNFISELKNKNEEALTFVIEEYGNYIYKIAYLYSNSLELSEECVNDVLLKIWKGIDGYKYDSTVFKKWVASITKYSSIDLMRKEKKHNTSTVLDENLTKCTDNIEDSLITKEELTVATKFMKRLNDVDKKIFKSRFLENKNSKEIAGKLNLTENAINLRVLRMRNKLKKYMYDLEGEE